MYKVTIDKDKCVGCGLCKSDCVGMVIDIVDGKAVKGDKGCIMCGHCEAICPQNAVTLEGFDDKVEEYEEQVRLNPEELLGAIKTRRSIRNFTSEKVPEEVIQMILEAGRLAPTGTNAQGTSYVVLEKNLNACEKIAVKMFGGLLNAGKLVIPALKSMELDEHFFFKKAPLAIVICGRDKVSASLAAQNMAFMAEANGLGVLFSGFFTVCANRNDNIRKYMGVDKRQKAVTTLVIGYPAVKYRRTAHRKNADVKRA